MHRLFLLLALSSAFAQNDDIDPALLASIFDGPKEATTASGAPFHLGGDGFGTTNRAKCICVPYHNCDGDRMILLDGESDGFGIIDIRFGQNDTTTPQQIKCKHYLDLCCTYPPNYTGPTITPSPDPTDAPISSDKPPVYPPVTIPTALPPTVRPPTPPPTLPPTVQIKCGQRNPDGVEFSIEGNLDREAEYGEFPWMVAVLRRNFVQGGKDVLSVCGGSLIHPQVVLTGAHCIENTKGLNLHASDIKVRAGEWDTQTDKERYPYQERNVETVIKHPNFHKQILRNDIVLLVLDEPFVYSQVVKPVCLPKQGQMFDQTECYASGWGKKHFGEEGNPSVILKKIDLPIVQHSVCQNLFRKTRLGSHFELDPSFICAGGVAGKDTCTGDGGSPLVCPDKGNPKRYTQAGLVAWGVGCGEDRVPGAYANVAMFRDWIDTQMHALNFDTSSYTE